MVDIGDKKMKMGYKYGNTGKWMEIGVRVGE